MPQKKMGRPKIDNPMDQVLKVRANAELMSKLNECIQELGISRSEIIRQGIDKMYQDLKHD